uniref:Intraflagellar transport protein 81 homolog n=1 Tax=Parastrongyloides trichosuri TaxID=131310 RepID=A0A0N4ZJ88_PARTI
MSVEHIRTLVNYLNAPPFSKNFNLITLDSLKNDKLLQILSDVLQWITNGNPIDIRSESPEETAIRMFNILRLVRFKAPKDLEDLQEWRTGIIEGEKGYVYPILYWIFTNTDKIKERIYLGKYLTKINIPPEYRDDEIMELENEVNNMMEEFKVIHKSVKEVKGDSILIEDIKKDLHTMGQEKEQLSRRVEKVMKKVMNIKGYERYLKLANQLRLSKEEGLKYRTLKQEQENFIINYSSKKKRLDKEMNEIEENLINLDPSKVIRELEEELESYNYILKEKLYKEIENKQQMINDLTQVVNMKSISKDDIINMNNEIETLNTDIMNLTLQRDNKDEANDDKLSIYRHQASNMARKKGMVAEILQKKREELMEVKNELEERKEKLKEKAGGGEVVSSSEMKKYVSKFRNKTFEYKKRKGLIDSQRKEIGILNGTVYILKREWKTLKKEKENRNEVVIESLLKKPEKPPGYERPKTGKVKTRNVTELRKLINEIKDEIEYKNNESKSLNNELLMLHDKINKIKKRALKKKDNTENIELIKIEGTLERIIQQINEEKKNIERHRNYVNKIDSDKLVPEMEDEEKSLNENINLLNKEITDLRKQETSIDQIEMWKGIQNIFNAKLSFLDKGY